MMFLAPVFLAAVGGVAASCALTAGARIAEGRPWLNGRSSCDRCGHVLSYAQTAPIASFIFLRGQCASCAAPIPRLHLAAEIGGAVLLPAAIALTNVWAGITLFLLAGTLLVASVIDLRTYRLPDRLNMLVAGLGITLSTFSGALAVAEGLAAAIIVALALSGLRLAIRAKNGDPGLGFGDVKLCAALALWLGAAITWAIAAAAGLGLIFIVARRARSERIPFGPFLAGAGLAVGVIVETVRWRLG